MFEKEREQIANAMRVVDTATSVKRAVDEKLKAGGISTEELAEVLRTEMRATFDVYRAEMNKNFEDHKRRMRQEAMWQWLICIAVIVAAVVKGIYL